MDLQPLQLGGRFAAVSRAVRPCLSSLSPLQHLETWNYVDRLYRYVCLQRLCEGSENVNDMKVEMSKVEVGTNKRVEKKKGKISRSQQ